MGFFDDDVSSCMMILRWDSAGRADQVCGHPGLPGTSVLNLGKSGRQASMVTLCAGHKREIT